MDDDALAALMQRIGGWSAMVGGALLMAAGIGFGGLTFGREAEIVLQTIAAQPRWYWPAVHLAFAAGSILWIGAFIALNSSFRETVARLLGSLGVVSMVLGAALHVVDSFISGSALTSLANQWATASATDRVEIVRASETLLMVLGGTWVGVVMLFHGVPFVFTGTSVARTERYPRFLRYVGVMAGFGSIFTGALMLVIPRSVPSALYYFFAAVGTFWMIGVGYILKSPPQPARRTQETLQVA
ncbi:MAG TPA: hypothetical protein VGQ52_01215 [Gemmatimonadaceae bacterium]|jgi:hypothetical protein|nr:hypothetical protein [Gemmatimonadaceae bacterium]